MAHRVSREAVRAAFALLCEKMGKKVATSYNDVGGWRLDYANGGFQVEEIVNVSGGISNPLGMLRHSPREMMTMIHFALDAVKIAEEPWRNAVALSVVDQVSAEEENPREAVDFSLKAVQHGLAELIRREPDDDMRSKQKEAARHIAAAAVLLDGGHGPATES